MFYIAAFLLILIIYFLLTSRVFLAENILNYLYIFLLVISVYKLVANKLFKYFQTVLYKINDFCLRFISRRNGKKYILIFVIFLILIISYFDKTYILGGDDTRLFFKYPNLYFDNYVNRIVPTSANSGWIGFLTPRVLYYFSGAMLLLNKLLPGINLQTFLYSLNMIGGFYFFNKLLCLVSEREIKIDKRIRLITSLMYVFSIFNIYVIFNAKLIAIFALTIVPLSIYLFIKGVIEKKLYMVLCISVIWSLFAVISSSVFWYSASFLTFLPVLIFLLRHHKKRAVIYGLYLSISLLILNIHWIIYLPYTSLFRSTQGSSEISLGSSEFINANLEGIRSTALYNEVFYPFNNLFHYGIQRGFSWPYIGIFESWYLQLIPLNIVFLIPVLLSNTLVSDRSKKLFLGISTLSFLLSIYFFTVNLGGTRMGNIGIEFFVYLSKAIPGFLSYRNMFDKFGHALSFNYSFALAISLAVIFGYSPIKKRINSILGILFVVIILNAMPLLLNRFDSLPVWKTQDTYHEISEFNSDYLDLSNYIEQQKYSGRYINLPLDGGNIMPIQAQYRPGHYYIGVSPLLVMTGKNDFSGFLSFGPYADQLRESLYKEDIKRFGEILQQTNTKYIISNNTISKDLQRSYLYNQELYDLQDEDFLEQIAGDKIQDFGNRYSLYEISTAYDSEKIYTTQDKDEIPEEFNGLEYTRINDYTYEVNIDSNISANHLVLMEPYYDEWDLYLEGEQLDLEQTVALGYANAWDIERILSNSQENIKLEIMFTPGKYKDIALTMSLISLISTITLIYWNYRKRND